MFVSASTELPAVEEDTNTVYLSIDDGLEPVFVRYGTALVSMEKHYGIPYNIPFTTENSCAFPAIHNIKIHTPVRTNTVLVQQYQP